MRIPEQLSPQEYERQILGPLDDVVQQMERTGVCVSVPRFNEIRNAALLVAEELSRDLVYWSGKPDLNWASPMQVQAFLHGDLGLPHSPYNKKGSVQDGKVSTDDRAIEWLADHFPEHRKDLNTLRDLRRAKRMAQYAEKWASMAIDRGGYATLHPSFGLASDSDDRPGAKTGRFAVKNPALNQVPADPDKDKFGIRTAFIAPPGHVVVACDASQLEVVLIAHKATILFGTTILGDKLRAGGDLHIQTARHIYGHVLGDAVCRDTPDELYKKNPHTKLRRGNSKNLRYGMHYRKGGIGFGATLFDEHGDAIGPEMGCKLVEAMYDAEPELRMLHDFGDWWTRKYGYTSSLFGRWVQLVGWDSYRTGIFNRARRREANWMPQASGQEILAIALINIANDEILRKLGYVLRLPVHDEIVGTCPEANAPEALARIRDHIKYAVELSAPLGAEGGFAANWAGAK